jgi:PAS domain-containing protein
MLESATRKTILILALTLALVFALLAMVLQEDVREKLGPAFYVIGFAIIGCVLLVLAGYIWDRALMKSLKTLRESAQGTPAAESGPEDTEHDEIIGLARKIEQMARSLQKVEASYRAVVEDQVDLICRYRADGKLTFVNGAYARALGRKRSDLIGQPFAFSRRRPDFRRRKPDLRAHLPPARRRQRLPCLDPARHQGPARDHARIPSRGARHHPPQGGRGRAPPCQGGRRGCGSRQE